VSSNDDLTRALSAALADVGLEGDVVDLDRLSGGASRETWSLVLRPTDGSADRALVLQRARAGATVAGPGMVGEARLVRAAAAAGVPVPEVMASGDDQGVGAPWVLTGRLDGETIPRKLLRDDEYADARAGLAAECGEALAAIHGIDPASVPDLAGGDQLEQLRTLADNLGEAHPAFELGFRWLEGNRPPTTDDAVVHGDFRLGNLLVDPSGLSAVLDWELAHRGDPFEDLGWLCVRAWRFGEPLPVGGFGSFEQLFGAYESARGVAVDPEVVRWWQVLGTLKWGLICILQSTSHLTGLSRSVELAAIGRRVCENEHDLLLLLP
jgi:aminoglycoside phosphotransferase (APT) family kinase protein